MVLFKEFLLLYILSCFAPVHVRTGSFELEQFVVETVHRFYKFKGSCVQTIVRLDT